MLLETYELRVITCPRQPWTDTQYLLSLGAKGRQWSFDLRLYIAR